MDDRFGWNLARKTSLGSAHCNANQSEILVVPKSAILWIKHILLVSPPVGKFVRRPIQARRTSEPGHCRPLRIRSIEDFGALFSEVDPSVLAPDSRRNSIPRTQILRPARLRVQEQPPERLLGQ
jgi:hypothetical protein